MAWKWYDSQLVDVVRLTPNTRSFWLKMDHLEDFDYRAGQFITLDLPIHEKRQKRWRSYSVANLPSRDGKIELCIVNMDHGLATEYLFNDIKIGDSIRFKGPDGTFTWTASMEQKEIVMVCTGTGVAPFRSMILDLKSKGSLTQPVHLIFGARKQEDILYREEFTRLAMEDPNFRYTVTLSREEWNGPTGYVHQVYLREYAERDDERIFLLCGWSKMIDEGVENLLLKLHYDKSQIRYELYG